MRLTGEYGCLRQAGRGPLEIPLLGGRVKYFVPLEEIRQTVGRGNPRRRVANKSSIRRRTVQLPAEQRCPGAVLSVCPANMYLTYMCIIISHAVMTFLVVSRNTTRRQTSVSKYFAGSVIQYYGLRCTDLIPKLGNLALEITMLRVNCMDKLLKGLSMYGLVCRFP